MAVDRSRLKARAAAGDLGAERALGITRRTSFMLSGAQLGITVTGLLVGYVAEPMIGAGIGDLLGGVGVPQAVGVAVGTVLALLFSTRGADGVRRAVPEEPGHRPAGAGGAAAGLVHGGVPVGVRVADPAVRPGVEPAAQGDRGSSRCTTSSTPRRHATSSTSWPSPATAVTCRRAVDAAGPHAGPARTHRRARDDPPAAGHHDRRRRAGAAGAVELMATGHSRLPVLGEDVDDVIGVICLRDVLALTRPTTARPAACGRWRAPR